MGIRESEKRRMREGWWDGRKEGGETGRKGSREGDQGERGREIACGEGGREGGGEGGS